MDDDPRKPSGMCRHHGSRGVCFSENASKPGRSRCIGTKTCGAYEGPVLPDLELQNLELQSCDGCGELLLPDAEITVADTGRMVYGNGYDDVESDINRRYYCLECWEKMEASVGKS